MRQSVGAGLFVGLVAAISAACAAGGDSTTAEVSEANPPASAADSGAAATSCTPGAPEICNGKDDNCDGRIDEGFDKDGDGYVSCAVGSKPADCDDADPAVHPGAAEICNAKDDDCNGKVDDGFDKDSDGYSSCATAGTGPVVDCDDTNPLIHPGAIESCNKKDDDCNGKVDDVPALLKGSLVAPVDPHFALAGAASLLNGWAQLTTDGSFYQAGAVWWNAPYTFDAFDVSATFWIQNKADGGEGLSFAWLPVNGVSAVGYAGPAYGVGGFGGYAVAVDTFQNPGDPATPFLALVTAAATPEALIRAPLPNVRDAQEHKLRVRLANAKVSAWVDGVSYIFEHALPGYVPYVGRWGFTGATGNTATESHWVKDIVMSFPNGQGCIP